MPKYQFCCENCSGNLGEDGSSSSCDSSIPFFDEETGFGLHPETLEYLFIIECKMVDKPNKPKCPNCGGKKTYTSFTGNEIVSYIRGNGIVNDKSGARRDMNRHHLQNGDPYGHMRQSGEVDHLLDKIRHAGMDMTKIRKERVGRLSGDFEKAKNEEINLTDDQIKILTRIDEGNNLHSDFEDIEDLNKVLSSLMPDYIYLDKNKNIYRLMAFGRKIVSELTE